MKPAVKRPVEVVEAYPVPLPRPIEVLMMAAANMQIEPASARRKASRPISSRVSSMTDSSAKGSMLMNEPVVAQKKRKTLGEFIEGITDSN